MNRVCSIFSQLLQCFPRLEFQSMVKQHKAERHARGFSSWGQFIAMMFCQLGRAHSLREICGGLAACEGKLKHLGLSDFPHRATLAYANEHRPWQLYQSVFFALLQRCQSEVRPGHKFRFKNKLLSMDASLISVCISMYDWAQYQRAKGAVKLHLMLDHDGYLPCFAVITNGKKHEISVARQMVFQPGTIVVFDKAYADYGWWKRLTQQGVHFVTRLRDDAKVEVLAKRHVPPLHKHILADEEIKLVGYRQVGKEGLAGLRRIRIFDPEQKRELVFVTNLGHLAASTIAAIYRQRWQIESFFKSLKQLLKIKTFVGTTENAVLTQIWTALIVMLLLRWLKLKAKFAWSLANLVALLRQQLFVYRDLWNWLNAPFEPPPLLAHQLALPWTAPANLDTI
jgi:hypothetical protein